MFKIVRADILGNVFFHVAFAILYKTLLPVLLSGKYYAGNYSQIKHSLKGMHD